MKNSLALLKLNCLSEHTKVKAVIKGIGLMGIIQRILMLL